MNPYRIDYIDSLAQRTNVTVSAESKAQAIAYSQIPESSITNVGIDWMSMLSSKGSKNKINLSLYEQSIFLVSVSGLIHSGETVRSAFNKVAAKAKKLKIFREDIKQCESIDDFLSFLNFDENIKTIARSGNESGKHAESLEHAAQFGTRLAESRSQIMSTIIMSFVKLGISFLALILGPFLFGGILYDLIYVSKANIQPNVASHILMSLRVFYMDFWYVTPILIGVMVYKKDALFDFLIHIPGLKSFHELIVVNRSILFLKMYQILLPVGYTELSILRNIAESAKGRDRKIYDELIYEVTSGSTLVSNLQEDEWPDIVSYILRDSEKKDIKIMVNLLDKGVNSLGYLQVEAGRKINMIMNFLAYASLIAAIFLLVIGYLLPQLTINAAVPI